MKRRRSYLNSIEIQYKLVLLLCVMSEWKLCINLRYKINYENRDKEESKEFDLKFILPKVLDYKYLSTKEAA